MIWKPYLQQLTATSVIVLWATERGEQAALSYGADQSYGMMAQGTTRTLPPLNTRLHRVQLTGLRPETVYHYRPLVDGENLLPDEPFSFRTAPATGSAGSFSFVAIGDYGKGTDAQRALRDQMKRDSFDFIISVGDNAYKHGSYSQFDANVMRIYGDVFARAALFPGLGNHDTYTNHGAPYLDLFELPPTAWREADAERYYSFDYGNAHFVVLDSTDSLDVDDAAAPDDMLDWLRDDLARTRQPWKIVVSHHPAYSSGTNHGSDRRSRTKLVPIYEQYGVALVLSGHDHIYQRTYPLRHDQTTSLAAGGVTYVVTGGGSQANYACRPASYVAARRCSVDYGIYTRISVTGACLTVQATRETGAELDRAVLCLPAAPPDPAPTPAPAEPPTPTSTAVPPQNPALEIKLRLPLIMARAPSR